jgi:small subunit ribosomal protein S4e
MRECLPLVILLRNRLKYALTKNEVTSIVKQRLIKVDGKVRTDARFPAGFMDVISIEKTGELFRLLYDTKGRFSVHRITAPEGKFKLGKVRRVQKGQKGIPFLVTHDARTIRYPHPDIKVNDTVKINLATGKITDFVKFAVGNLVMITGGHNLGRVGVIVKREKHAGSFEIVHVKDAVGHVFATRLGNVFVIGKGTKSMVTLPSGKGVKKSILEEAAERAKRRARKTGGGSKAKKAGKKAGNANKTSKSKKPKPVAPAAASMPTS